MSMFPNRIDRLFEEMRRDMSRSPYPPAAQTAHTPSVDPREYEGYRTEIVNGTKREFVLEDGEWKEVGADDKENDVQYEVTAGSDEPTVLTIDAEPMVSGDKDIAAATLTNGVLEITFDDGPDVETED